MPSLLPIILWFGLIAFAFTSGIIFRKVNTACARLVFLASTALILMVWPLKLSQGQVQSAPATNDEIAMLLELDDDDLLEEIQKKTFTYFWDFGHPSSGMIRERNTSGDLVTIGGTGFGMMAIIVGIHRQFITRQEGFTRISKIIHFLADADRFHGAWPHWMNGNTGKVIPFSAKDNGGDLVETAFLIQGLLTARSYFDVENEEENALRDKITTLWEGVDWNWYRKQVQTNLFWHWSPDFGFEINLPIRGWNETMITYILGIASPTHTLPSNLYHKGWAASNYVNGQTHYGIKLPLGRDTGGPLFFTHYSFLGLDPRNKQDDYANYFFQGRNQSLINRAYCIENPEMHEGYSENGWGLTASDDPDGYSAHAPTISADNGTLTPSASISAIAYVPDESIAAARHLLAEYGEKVWGPMGFYDALNPSRDWFADSYLAIDQGPIICMIENHRSGILWDYFMRNAEIQTALADIGFRGDTSTTATLQQGSNVLNLFPNPVQSTTQLTLPEKGNHKVWLDLLGVDGRFITRQEVGAIDGIVKVNLFRELANGTYLLKTTFGNRSFLNKVLINR